MKTPVLFAAAGLMLASVATCAIAAPPGSAGSEGTAAAAPGAALLTREAVIAELVKSRQQPYTQSRDGEWYNVPAPLGGMAQKARFEYLGAAPAQPARQSSVAYDAK